ncbi:hypothetical protein K504DRAFT_505533 [Pleomassaria siparia CBS 279.74]|uniref:Uncharacterized protein n=1 Tax=Pleomassaria siparia CBS 279.74 TaxID=1314801 RepID=A0A6G1JYW3_9PLEO|nr:hypothetical protein K504DRAFT_505533 [Pleomassaria siparia CBS 279.74]
MSPLAIFELRELILSNLPYQDITQARIEAQQLWKVAMPSRDPDAHFKTSWAHLINSLDPKGKAFTRRLHRAMRLVLQEEPLTWNTWHKFEDQALNFNRHYMPPAHYDDSSIIFWCEDCLGFHPKFQYENVHPLLRGLQKVACINGDGSRLIINTAGIGGPNFPTMVSDLFQLCDFLVDLTRRWEGRTWKRFKDVMLTRPICTRLVVASGYTHEITVAKPNGITVGDAVLILAKVCYNAVRFLDAWDIQTHVNYTMESNGWVRVPNLVVQWQWQPGGQSNYDDGMDDSDEEDAYDVEEERIILATEKEQDSREDIMKSIYMDSQS